MSRPQDDDTRYFVEIDLQTLQITKCSYDQKENLDKGHQTNSAIHRLFLTKGQYNKFISRCALQLEPVLED